MALIAHLIRLADEYTRLTGSRDVTVSFWVFNDSKKLAALRGGSDITVTRFNAALVWFSANWPKGAEWPSDIDRPDIVSEAAE